MVLQGTGGATLPGYPGVQILHTIYPDSIPPGLYRRLFLIRMSCRLFKRTLFTQEKAHHGHRQQGQEVNQGTINWSQYPRLPFPYTLRQNPGPESALGRIKISFPINIPCTCTTPAQGTVRKRERTFSSGCIRLEKPFELAELLFDDPAR